MHQLPLESLLCIMPYAKYFLEGIKKNVEVMVFVTKFTILSKYNR